MDLAKVNFKKGMNDLKRERDDLTKKINKSSEEENRIVALDNEINRLTQFVQDLRNRKLLK